MATAAGGPRLPGMIQFTPPLAKRRPKLPLHYPISLGSNNLILPQVNLGTWVRPQRKVIGAFRHYIRRLGSFPKELMVNLCGISGGRDSNPTLYNRRRVRRHQ